MSGADRRPGQEQSEQQIVGPESKPDLHQPLSRAGVQVPKETSCGRGKDGPAHVDSRTMRGYGGHRSAAQA